MSEHDNKRLPRPEEFPLGTIESRAAARALFESREKTVRFGFSDDDPSWEALQRECSSRKESE